MLRIKGSDLYDFWNWSSRIHSFIHNDRWVIKFRFSSTFLALFDKGLIHKCVGENAHFTRLKLNAISEELLLIETPLSCFRWNYILSNFYLHSHKNVQRFLIIFRKLGWHNCFFISPSETVSNSCFPQRPRTVMIPFSLCLTKPLTSKRLSHSQLFNFR